MAKSKARTQIIRLVSTAGTGERRAAKIRYCCAANSLVELPDRRILHDDKAEGYAGEAAEAQARLDHQKGAFQIRLLYG